MPGKWTSATDRRLGEALSVETLRPQCVAALARTAQKGDSVRRCLSIPAPVAAKRRRSATYIRKHKGTP
jgi:hypothetical protein